jgi:hypothetical protein
MLVSKQRSWRNLLSSILSPGLDESLLDVTSDKPSPCFAGRNRGYGWQASEPDAKKDINHASDQ